MYYIDKKFLGTNSHVTAVDGNMTTIENVPHTLLPEDGTHLPGTLTAFLKIIGKQRSVVPEEIKNSCDICRIPPENLGLSHLMRPKEFSKNLIDFNEDIQAYLSDIKKYVPFYIRNIKTLNSCSQLMFKDKSCGIDIDAAGYAQPIVYDTAVTKTGRMSVISGPNVLTMQKDVKHKIMSRFTGGKIVEIDYSALEPRVALAIADSDFAGSNDVYSELGSVIGIRDRGIAKQLIISFLYGAGLNTMCRLTGFNEPDLRSRINGLKEIFQQDFVVEKIKSDLQSNGYFYNHAGRPIFPTSDRFGVLFNNFCQSTAVDVSLSGFSKLLSMMHTSGLAARAICFIHDAVLIDSPSEEVSILNDMSKKLPTYLGIDFPTKLTVMDNYK